MEEPGIIKSNRGSVRWLCVILFSSCLYLNFSCNATPKTMETRGTVKGIIVDQSGKPVNDAIVMIVDGTTEFNDIASVSNEDGEFYISNVVIPGRYVLQIQGKNQKKIHEVNLQSKDIVVRIAF